MTMLQGLVVRRPETASVQRKHLLLQARCHRLHCKKTMTSRTPVARLFTRQVAEDSSDTFSDFPQEWTAFDCLSRTENDLLQEVPSRSYDECAEFLFQVASRIAPRPRTALSLRAEPAAVSSGLPGLDTSLNGGFRAGHLVELVGRAGSGKTQWSMTLAASLAVRQRGVIYFDSERKFSPERFREILIAKGGVDRDSDRVRVVRPDGMTAKSFISLVKSFESSLAADNVGLIVLDSISDVVRGEHVSIVERQQNIAKVANALKQLADSYQLPVIVTNQVMGTLDNGTVASLGTMWYHLLNMRLLLSVSDVDKSKRQVEIVKSPEACEAAHLYTIDSSGIAPFLAQTTKEEALKEWNEVLAQLSPQDLGVI